MGLVYRLRSLAALALIAVSVSACGYNVIRLKQEAANAASGRGSKTSISDRWVASPTWWPRLTGLRQAGKGRLCPGDLGRASKATSIHLDANDLTDPAKVKQLQDETASPAWLTRLSNYFRFLFRTNSLNIEYE